MALVGQARAVAESRFEDYGRCPQATALLARLTKREREILTSLVAGQHTRQIAEDLGLNTRTVEVHRANIIRNFGVNNIVGVTDICLTKVTYYYIARL